ncbi:MAG: hypothetical protein ACR2P6_04255 [Gammaproteobacteria bacterium]
MVAIGNRLGISALNRRLNRTRFFLHAVFIAGLIPGYAGIGRLARVESFATDWFNIGIGALTIAVMLFGYFVGYRSLGQIVPVNYYGCLRYAQAVTTTSRRKDYAYSDAELELTGFPPFTSIITVLIGLALSLWIGLTAGYWIPAIATGLMMLAGSFPPKAWAALATSCLEIIFSAGIVYSLVELAGA